MFVGIVSAIHQIFLNWKKMLIFVKVVIFFFSVLIVSIYIETIWITFFNVFNAWKFFLVDKNSNPKVMII